MLTYAIQKTGYDYAQLDSQGNTDFDGFIEALERFPWSAQLARWNEVQDGPLPAMVLSNEADRRELWISALGAGLADSFQLNVVAMREKKALFGLGKPKLDREVTSFEVYARADLDRLCRLFCNAQYADMDREVAKLAELDREADDDR